MRNHPPEAPNTRLVHNEEYNYHDYPDDRRYDQPRGYTNKDKGQNKRHVKQYHYPNNHPSNNPEQKPTNKRYQQYQHEHQAKLGDQIAGMTDEIERMSQDNSRLKKVIQEQKYNIKTLQKQLEDSQFYKGREWNDCSRSQLSSISSQEMITMRAKVAPPKPQTDLSLFDHPVQKFSLSCSRETVEATYYKLLLEKEEDKEYLVMLQQNNSIDEMSGIVYQRLDINHTIEKSIVEDLRKFQASQELLEEEKSISESHFFNGLIHGLMHLEERNKSLKQSKLEWGNLINFDEEEVKSTMQLLDGGPPVQALDESQDQLGDQGASAQQADKSEPSIREDDYLETPGEANQAGDLNDSFQTAKEFPDSVSSLDQSQILSGETPSASKKDGSQEQFKALRAELELKNRQICDKDQEISRLTDEVARLRANNKNNREAKQLRSEIARLQNEVNRLENKLKSKQLIAEHAEFDKKQINVIRRSLKVAKDLGFSIPEVRCLFYCDKQSTNMSERYQFNYIFGVKGKTRAFNEVILVYRKDLVSQEPPKSSDVYRLTVSKSVLDVYLNDFCHVVAWGEIGEESRVEVHLGERKRVTLANEFKSWFSCGFKKIRKSKQGNVLKVRGTTVYFISSQNAVVSLDLKEPTREKVLYQSKENRYDLLQDLALLDDLIFVADDGGNLVKIDQSIGSEASVNLGSQPITAITAFNSFVAAAVYDDEYKETIESSIQIYDRDMSKKCQLRVEDSQSCIRKIVAISLGSQQGSVVLVLLPADDQDVLPVLYFNWESLTRICCLKNSFDGKQISSICEAEGMLLVGYERLRAIREASQLVDMITSGSVGLIKFMP